MVVVDSDDTPVHNLQTCISGCRLCQVKWETERTLQLLGDRPQGSLLRIAVGCAVPAIEAWYLSGLDPHVTEAAWIQALQDGKKPYTRRSLKTKVYGTLPAPTDVLLERAVEAAQRLREDWSRLEQDFPAGFGSMAAEIRSWAED